MIISKQYGPQFDGTDGTIGELKLEKRWIIVDEKDHFKTFYPRQGRYSYKEEEVRELLAAINDMCDITHRTEKRRDRKVARAWWCYPGHLDPAGPVEPKEIISL